MKIILCFALFLKCSILAHVTILNKFGTDYLRHENAIQDFVRDGAFRSACESHFQSARVLTVMVESWDDEIWSDTVSDVLEAMYKHLNIPIILIYWYVDRLRRVPVLPIGKTPGDQVREYPPESSHSYLIIAHTSWDYYYPISDNTKYPQNEWTPKHNYMILVILHRSWYECTSRHYYKELFEAFWSHYWILNIITMVKYLNICGRDTDIMVYNPFDANKNDGLIYVTQNHLTELPKSYLERTWNLGGFAMRVTMFHSFPNAVFKCKSRCVCSYEGRDWEVIKNLAMYMNFTPVVNQPWYEEALCHEHKSGYTGSMEDLVYKRADISGNERYIKSYNTDKIEFTMPAFYTMQLVVVVPKAQRILPWRAIFQRFTLQFWMYLLGMLLVTAVLWHILRKMYENISCLATAADTMSVFLAIPVTFLTKVTSSSQRLLLSSCLFFSLVIMCFFESSLLDAACHPYLQPDIDTLKELDESGLPIFTCDPDLMDTFGWSPAMKNLNVKLQFQNLSSETLLHQMAHYRNISLMTSKAEALWFLSKYPNKFHIVNEYPREYFVSYMIPRGSPYATRIHNLLGKMNEAGLVRKWDRDTSYRLQLEGLREGRAIIQDNKNVKVLGFAEFQLSFLIWGIGLTAGTVVFVLERSF